MALLGHHTELHVHVCTEGLYMSTRCVNELPFVAMGYLGGLNHSHAAMRAADGRG